MVKPNSKRKLDNYQETPSKKVLKDTSKTSVIALKDMKKVDLIQYCESIEALNEQLRKENESLKMEIDQNNAAVEDLHEKISKIEKNQKDEYGCCECDFVANCIHDHEDHSHDPLEFECYHCLARFETKHLVMIHTKHNHEESVPHCVKYLETSCEFSNNCWFLHDESLRESKATFKCNFCENMFKTKYQLMRHKKIKHVQKVKMCINEKKGCKFGHEKCWFLHNENIEELYKNAKSNT